MKKNGSRQAKASVVKKTTRKNVEHASLGVLRADFHDLFAVGHGCLGGTVQLHVSLDELNGAIRAGDHRLHARAGEPVNHRAAHDDAEQERGVQNAQFLDGRDILHRIGEHHDD